MKATCLVFLCLFSKIRGKKTGKYFHLLGIKKYFLKCEKRKIEGKRRMRKKSQADIKYGKI